MSTIKIYETDGQFYAECKTQKEAAAKLGVSISALSKAVNGKMPTVAGYVASKDSFIDHCLKHNIPFELKAYSVISTMTGSIVSICEGLLPVAFQLKTTIQEAARITATRESINGNYVTFGYTTVDNPELFLRDDRITGNVMPSGMEW